MNSTYTELKIFTSDTEQQELLIAILSEFGFEGFVQDETELHSYIITDEFENIRSNPELNEVFKKYHLRYELSDVVDKNWNEEWEKNFEPVLIENKIYIRAEFHKKRTDVQFDIVINPKMSFGTGHHDTTAMMMKYMLGINFKEAEVFDFGAGTGILSILAAKLGAKSVLAIDNDSNACINMQENLTENLVNNVEIRLCDITGIEPNRKFDDILANINRNTILHDLTVLYNKLKPTGCLLISGILKSDMNMISTACSELGLVMTGSLQSEQWAALCFKKPL
jgi:ribosomal protein L11 methyltransferase